MEKKYQLQIVNNEGQTEDLSSIIIKPMDRLLVRIDTEGLTSQQVQGYINHFKESLSADNPILILSERLSISILRVEDTNNEDEDSESCTCSTDIISAASQGN